MTKLIKYSIFLAFGHFLLAHECIVLNQGDYGSCNYSLGYSWNGNGCSDDITGCSQLNLSTGISDSDAFYLTYEQCVSSCFQHTGTLGDLNEDLEIDILDIVILINVIIDSIDSSSHQVWAGDVNQDGFLDVLDIVTLINIIIISNQETRDTFQIISEDIFGPACVGCHYQGSFYAEESGLVMEEDILYNEIINAIPTNSSAAADGLVLISNEGGIAATQLSYLWEKINVWDQEHYYADHPYYGDLMPLGGPFLTNGELAFIEKWILEGAPESGVVATPSLLLDNTSYEPPAFIALEEPEQGFQFHLGPFDVEPGGDKEFLYYESDISDEDIFIKRVQISMRPGSHHFIFYTFNDDIPSFMVPEPQVYRDLYNEDGSTNVGTLISMSYHRFVSGTQWPSMDYEFPEGIALRMPSDYGLDLNGHYFNYTDQTIVGEIYANIHTVDEDEVEHVAEILMLNNTDFYLPPNEVTTIEKTYSYNQIKNIHDVDNDIDTIYLFQLFTHAHQLMERFDIQYYDSETGETQLIYTALDYEHPPILTLNNPLELKQGDYIRLQTTYNNTNNNPVEFGLMSTDEMMILFGYFYY
tara:strand:- start:272 stop:2023 length:1752 start_codon:yes stop_codon:yes gene_type:complete